MSTRTKNMLYYLDLKGIATTVPTCILEMIGSYLYLTDNDEHDARIIIKELINSINEDKNSFGSTILLKYNCIIDLLAMIDSTEILKFNEYIEWISEQASGNKNVCKYKYLPKKERAIKLAIEKSEYKHDLGLKYKLKNIKWYEDYITILYKVTNPFVIHEYMFNFKNNSYRYRYQ